MYTTPPLNLLGLGKRPVVGALHVLEVLGAVSPIQSFTGSGLGNNQRLKCVFPHTSSEVRLVLANNRKKSVDSVQE